MIHREVSDFSFSGCLKIYLKFSIPLTEYVAHLPRHHMYSLSLPSGIMPKVSITLHLRVAFDDITRQLVNCNNNNKFFACPYSVLHELHSEIARKLHAWRTYPDRVLKRSASSTNELDITWDLGIGSVFSRDESLLPTAYALSELS